MICFEEERLMRAKRLAIPLSLSLLSVAIGTLAVGCAGGTWDYVALGDSTPDGYGVSSSYVDYFAEFIEEDLGAEVEVHNFSQSGQSTSSLLSQLEDRGDLREAIREAEVITIWTGWNDLVAPLGQYRSDMCGGEDNLDCIREAVAELNANIDAILDQILSLTSPQDALIRIADVGIPFVNTWTYNGWFETLQGPCYEAWRDHLIEAAEKRGITVVNTYHILNGPNGDQAVDEGLMQRDGVHFNEEGHRLVARLHREAGYAYAP
jgi:lysophospholipase L1-like esterase